LKAELVGDNEHRRLMLASAIASFPDHAPARWHAGSIQTGDGWLAVEDAERATAADGRVSEYRKLRGQYAASPAGQEALARWCRKYKLPDLEKLHWVAVLRLNPQHREARKRLAVREYQGMLLTKEELDERQRWQEKRDKEFEYWQTRLRKLVTAIESGDLVAKQEAIEQFRQIDDAAAIPAMHKAMSETKEDLTEAFLHALANMPGQAAMDQLIRIAVLSPIEAHRAAAVKGLKDKPLFGYVPQLLGGLEAPVELSYYVNTFADGLQYGYEAMQERPDGTYVQSRNKSDALLFTRISIQRGTGRVDVNNPFRIRIPLLARAGARELASVREAIDETNRRAALTNERILDVLRQTTGQQLPNDPQAWWQWWSEYNELGHSEQRTIRDDGVRYSIVSLPTQISLSCFLRGTQVWTDTGALPIEAVRVGDRVLSQDQETGELAYKLVLDTTVRPPSPTLRIGVGDEEIATTLGHPIWVAGKGWRMAKELKPGELLHGVHGGVPIDYIEPGPEAEAYNLVVADFNSYFVGNHRVLVHDNLARAVTAAVLPGLVMEAD
jgi:hypothetical protein